MIVYFADRQLNILGQSSTNLPNGLLVSNDRKSEEIETGVAVFECKVKFDEATREQVELCCAVGNYILRKHDGENEFYTIIESELDTKKQNVYIYAEDAGLDLLNEVVGEYEADQAYPIEHYVEKFAYDSGFRIGINEAASLTRKLSWDGEQTVTARLASVATQFDGCEISYSFDIKGLLVTDKYINIHKKRGQDNGVTLRLNKDIDSIVTTTSIANLATALRCTGGTPDGADDPISLRGYSYDDGDFYILSDCVASRTAVARWSRYLNPNEPNKNAKYEGHIVKLFSYDTTEQSTLLAHAITELKKLREVEVNYEVDIRKLPDNVKIGDRVNIVDEAGKLYLSTRLLQLEVSVSDQEQKAVLGEHLIKSSGIHQKVADLAEQFAKNSHSAKRALEIANSAKTAADQAKAEVDDAVKSVEEAQKAVEEVAEVVETAKQSAENAQKAADEAQAVVDGVDGRITNLETTVGNAQQAADNAQQAAQEAEEKADAAVSDAAKAKADAADAKASLDTVQTQSATAIEKAEAAEKTAETAKADADDAKATAEAAKLDAQTAQDEIDNLGNRLDSVVTTMEADYARKTDLTESEAHLQSQISQNAGVISSTVSMLSIIDETTNDAQDQAEKALRRAEEARAQADQASADALTAQQTANEAAQSAQEAQANADSAQAAVDSAQAILDEAEADLATAQAELEEVLSRGDATEAEIAAAQMVVVDAQAAANEAKADADEATERAAEAQARAYTAHQTATDALATANAAASYAKIAQAVASEEENASAAQARADEAAQTATDAQRTADSATKAAADAKAAADKAAEDAAQAVADAEAADAQVVQAAATLVEAKQRLADVLADADATQDAIEEAQTAVDAAQIAVDEAKANATEAAAYAAQAAIDAAEAQTLADNARAKADDAQAKADAAQTAADEAKAAADSLEIRVIQSESDFRVTANEISGRVTSVETTLTESVNSVDERVEKLTKDVEAKVTAEAVELQISTALENGTSKVVTKTGYKFDDDGMTVQKSGSEMKTQITENGMTVFQNDEAVLTANNAGVDAKNLHATTYLIVGKNSRFEDFGENRTGCFWIGG